MYVCTTSFRRRAMLARPCRSKLVFTIIIIIISAVVVVSVVDLLSRRWLSFELITSRALSDNTACNRVCFVVPRTGNRLGNHLFYVAALHYVASITSVVLDTSITHSDDTR